MEILEKIANMMIEADADKERIEETINEALRQGISPMDVIQGGLSKGLQVVGKKFEEGEFYLPEMMLSADVMKAGMSFLMPYIKDRGEFIQREGSFLIGTIEGDVHDIGKNIVATFLELAGFEVHDLGLDVPAHTFVTVAEERQVDIIGVSALLTSTMTFMPDVIEELKARNLREKYLVMVGGSPVTADYAQQIGADGYGGDFMEAIKAAKQLIQARKER